MNSVHWPLYVWAGAVALAVVAAAWTAANRREVRAELPIAHVAGATLVATFGWQMLVHLPGAVLGYWNLTAGLGEVDGVREQQAYVVGQAVFVVGAAFAVVGILRRRTWGAVLGIGLALSHALSAVIATVNTFMVVGDSMDGGMYLNFVASTIGLGAVPGLVAAVLLTVPLWQTTPPVDAARADWNGEPAAADRI